MHVTNERPEHSFHEVDRKSADTQAPFSSGTFFLYSWSRTRVSCVFYRNVIFCVRLFFFSCTACCRIRAEQFADLIVITSVLERN